jgi:hypothetical protein
MKIDWAALGLVAVISIAMTVMFVLLLSGGIRLVSEALDRSSAGQSGTAVRTAGYSLLGCAGLLVLFGIYLILPLSS